MNSRNITNETSQSINSKSRSNSRDENIEDYEHTKNKNNLKNKDDDTITNSSNEFMDANKSYSKSINYDLVDFKIQLPDKSVHSISINKNANCDEVYKVL